MNKLYLYLIAFITFIMGAVGVHAKGKAKGKAEVNAKATEKLVEDIQELKEVGDDVDEIINNGDLDDRLDQL